MSASIEMQNNNSIKSTDAICAPIGLKSMTPAEIISELDKHIVGQAQAKRAVAIALRNRWRRQQVAEPLRHEITPKNILMIGATGVGKTEIARRLAKLAQAPFIKVEATKFTEVGYVGRDVDSIIRDLMEIAVKEARDQAARVVRHAAKNVAENKILDILLEPSLALAPDPTISTVAADAGTVTEGNTSKDVKSQDSHIIAIDIAGSEDVSGKGVISNSGNVNYNDGINNTNGINNLKENSTRQLFRKKLREGALDDKEIEISITQAGPRMEIMTPPGMEEMAEQLKSIFSQISPEKKSKRTLKIKEAFRLLTDEAASKLLNKDEIHAKALHNLEENGIVFLDEIDKICARHEVSGVDISRAGVQRDLLPLVEGTTVNTKFGVVRTDHILFIASGAFHLAKPSDLIPELQGRFPIRVELNALSVTDFAAILTQTDACLTKQYQALMETELITLEFTENGIEEIAQTAFAINERDENIGARRLHTIMEKLLEDLSFTTGSKERQTVTVDSVYVSSRLAELAGNQDLSRYVL